MRLGLRRPAHRAQYARALHHMPEAAESSDHSPTGTRRLVARASGAAANAPCGWRCGVRLTASQMRAHFTICAKRQQLPTTWTGEEGTRKPNADAHRAPWMPAAGLRHPAYRAQYARALHNMREAAWQARTTRTDEGGA